MAIVRKFGGGGGSPQTVSQIPDWMRPYLETGLSASTNALKSGELSNVVGQNQYQKYAQDAAVEAAGGQQSVAQHSAAALDQLGRIAAGEEIVPSSTGATEAIKQAAIHQANVSAQPGIATAAARGTVGGARNLIQAGAGQNDLAAKLAGIDYQDLSARRQAAQTAAGTAIQGGAQVQDQLISGANTIKGVGADIQKADQAQADRAFTGLQRFSSVLQGTPWQSQQAVQQGGK